MTERGRPLLLAAAAAALTILPGDAVARGSFSLEDVLSAPYPTTLVAAATAERIAWTENERGARSLWTAAAPGFEAERLVLYPDDDGQEVSDLALTADGAFLVYVRGGAPNTAGEHPNPAGFPDAPERAIWAVATAGGEPRRLAEGASPVVLPGARSLVFARSGELFEVAIEATGGEESVVSRLFGVRGSVSSVTPAPDGRRLAFVSSRGDHSFVGIFHREERRVVWMAPGFDRDLAPAWSGDGARIAFLRTPGALRGELPDYNAEVRFALHVGDPDTGQARAVWSSPGPDGGFVNVFTPRPLSWAGDRLVFASEAGGWRHFWSVPAEGGAALELTPGAGIAEWATLTGDGNTLIFGGNFADAHARHLWRVGVDGSARQRLTEGAVVDAEPVVVGSRVAFRRSTARQPPAVSILTAADGPVRRVSRDLPARFPQQQLLEPDVVSLVAGDGFLSHAQVFVPEDSAGERRPAVIFLHGGPMRQMLPAFHYSSYYSGAYAFNQYLASRGYVVLALNFRSGIGYGRAFRAAPKQGPRGASEYADLVAAARYLRGRSDVDPERIGLWGGSYGGFMTALGLARDSHLFAAGVDLHGVHDWAWRGEHFHLPGGYWGLQPGDYELARRSSPVFDVASWSSPVLFVHGDDDRNVDFVQSTDLVQRLRRRGVQLETLVFPDEVHGFLRYGSWLETFRRSADFFDRFLGGGG